MRTKKTEAVTGRFLAAMHEIIKKNKIDKGRIATRQAFAESIGQSPQNFAKLNNNGQHVSMSIIAEVCRKYRVNPTYLILGEGDMFLSDDLRGKITEIEKRLLRLEKR